MNDRLTIICGDALEKLRELPDESVQCCVTSPPYWGLRDYGTPNQIGLEKSPEEYVSKIVDVFAEVRRVLKDDGTVWLNLGDSYASSWPCNRRNTIGAGSLPNGKREARPPRISDGLKEKDLIGIPWRVAFALQSAGWYLRSDIIWHKPNPMPESVTDRPTKAHEYIFLLTKSQRYFYDAESIKEPAAESVINDSRLYRDDYEAGRPERGFVGSPSRGSGLLKPSRSGNKERKPASACGVPIDTNGSTNGAVAGSVPWEGFLANKKTVWTVTTKPYPEAHFATYPPDLIKPCIRAGCMGGGTVLDPFAGSGTTGMVALELGRKAILIELNAEYVKLIERRCDVTPGLPL